MKRITGIIICLLTLLMLISCASGETRTSGALIEEETYYFEDADYTVNGLVVHFDSITLKRVAKPAGYEVAITYYVENLNSTEATFAFSTLNGNCFELNGKRTTLSTLATWSKSYETKFPLNANETSDQYIGDFFASSLFSSKTIDGTTYEPIDIANLYSGQVIGIELTMDGYVGDSVESIIAAFEIEL